MRHGSKPEARVQARDGLIPFGGVVPDRVMIDKAQSQLFSALGRTRSPFHGVAAWPVLDDLLARRSREVLEVKGAAQWAAAGGVRGPDGKLTCAPTSTLAAQVVREVAADPGGLLWADTKGTVWAVRLVPAADRDPASFFGFALSWGGNGALLDPEVGAKNRESRRKNWMEEARSRLGLQARWMRLAARAAQLLTAIHLAVTAQRRSVVLLPDVLLGQVVYGGDRDHWPRDWRHDIMQTLVSLTDLRAEVLRLSAAGWRLQFGAHSVAIAHVEQLWVTRLEEDFCRPCRPMWNSADRHGHLLAQTGYGFLGVLEKFATGSESTCRTFDFQKTPPNEVGEEVGAARKAGATAVTAVPRGPVRPVQVVGAVRSARGRPHPRRVSRKAFREDKSAESGCLC